MIIRVLEQNMAGVVVVAVDGCVMNIINIVRQQGEDTFWRTSMAVARVVVGLLGRCSWPPGG